MDTGYTVKRLLNDNMQNNLHSDSLEESHTRGMGSTPHHSRHITHLTTLCRTFLCFVLFIVQFLWGDLLWRPLDFSCSYFSCTYRTKGKVSRNCFFQQQGIEPFWKPSVACTKRSSHIVLAFEKISSCGNILLKFLNRIFMASLEKTIMCINRIAWNILFPALLATFNSFRWQRNVWRRMSRLVSQECSLCTW